VRPSPLSLLASATRHILGIIVVAAVSGLLVAGLALPLVGASSVAARSTVESFTELPADFEATPQAQRSVVLDAEGRELAVFFDEYRVYKPIDQIAPVMLDAIIAIEDARFYDHGPIDLQGTARALVTNVSSGTVEQGGSTLTQQYVKNVLLSQAETDEEARAAVETSYSRKLRELRLAMAAEEQFTKDQILERYLNLAYFGGGAYGIEAAAQRFYSTPASELTLNQAATLAGLVQSPSRYDPEKFAERAVARRNNVLAAMVANEAVTEEEADTVAQEPLSLEPSPTTNGCAVSYAPFFCDFVYRELMDSEALGETVEQREQTLRRGGLLIKTTLQPREQQAARDAVRAYVAPEDRAVGAIAVVEPGTGHITAMTNSMGYGSGDGKTFVNFSTDFDRGGSGGFQSGSTMKPFVLAAAIKQGVPLNTRINAPASLTHNTAMRICDGVVTDSWEVGNYDSSGGSYDLRTGTWRSVNTFFALLEERTGICEPVKIAEAGGLTRASGQDLLQIKSFVLGSQEVSPLAMAEAYAMFAARGTHCESVAITSITTPTGDELPVPPSNCAKVLDSGTADAVNQVLVGTIDGPDPGRTGARMTLGRPAAGKTGTTDNSSDIWFAGYTPQRSAVVAITNPTRVESLRGYTLNGVYYSEVCGGCIPGPIWQQAMAAIMEPLEVRSFAEPDPSDVAGVSATVPDVRGLSGAEAVATLQAAGFEAYVAAEVNSSVPRGLTVSTDPGAGASYFSGSTVRVFTSTGFVPPPPPPPPPSPQEPEPEPDQPAPEPEQPPAEPDQTDDGDQADAAGNSGGAPGQSRG
jgi:membrane peptidoglycan carboxypeptidase